MHIGFITSHFPFPDAKSVGGIGTSIKNLGDELVRLGHKVTVFVYGQPADADFLQDGIMICKIRNAKFKGLSWLLTRKKIQRKIAGISQASKIDIIEAPDWEGITSFINADCPIVLRLHGSDTYFCHLDGRKVKYLNRFHEKRAYAKASAIVAVSRFTGEVTNSVFGLQKEFTVIPNGIDAAKFQPGEAREAGEKVILYFGGIIRKKGVLEIPHYFNRIASRYPEAKLVMIGSDMPDKLSGNASTVGMVQALFSEKALGNFRFLGSVPYHRIREHILRAEVCIFPSYAEAMPVSWLEAMAMQKAVVASDIGWSNEIITDGIDGFKVYPGNHEAFSDKIMMLLEDEKLREALGEAAGKRIAERFSVKAAALESLQFYNSIIVKRNA